MSARTAASTSDYRPDDTVEKAALLVREGAFGRASALAQTNGLVQDPDEAARALAALHPPRRRVPGFVPPGAPARTPPQGGNDVEAYHLTRAIRNMPKRAATHVDGWRWEHIRDLAAQESGADALLQYIGAIVRADVPPVIADYLASATLFPFNKQRESTVDELREQAQISDPDTPFTPPTRPVAVSSVLVRMASSCLLEAMLPAIQQAVGNAQYGIKTPDALEKIIFGVRAAMEGLRGSVTVHLDMKNAFNEISRERTWQELMQDPSLAPMRPLYRLLYLDREGEMWYYRPGAPTPYATIPSAEGSRQGCVFGNACFCIPFVRFLNWISELSVRRGEQGVPFAYIDDCYVVASRYTAAHVIQQAPRAAMDLLGLTLNVQKTEVIRPYSETGTLEPPLLDDPIYGSPYVSPRPPSPGPSPGEVLEPYYTDAALVLGVPIGNPTTVADLMSTPTTRHARLMNLVDKLAKTGHPHAALRLLQVCGVRRYQHFLRGLPPDQSLEPLATGDMLVRDSLLQLLRMSETEHADHAGSRDIMARASLPTRMGGLNLPRTTDEAELAHVAAYAAAAEDLHSRLTSMAGNRAAETVADYLSAVPEDTAWGDALRSARRAVTPLLSLDPESVANLREAAPEGPPTFRCGVRLNRARPPARFREGRAEYRDAYADIASLRVPACSAMTNRRVKGLQAKLSRARRARAYLSLLGDLTDAEAKRETARLLSSSGGGVAFTVSDDLLHPRPRL